MVVESSIHIILPVVIGFLIGILEAYFIYEDEGNAGLNGFFGKVWHGILFSILGVVIATNIPYIISLGFLPEFVEGLLFINEQGISYVACVLVMIIMFIKIDTAHRVRGLRGGGFVEKPWHKALVSGLIGFSPLYIFPMYNIDFIVQLAIPFI